MGGREGGAAGIRWRKGAAPAALRIGGMAVVVAGLVPAPAGAQIPAAEVRVPDGFQVSIAASGLDDVRTLKIGPEGALYAVLSRPGRIVRFPDPDDAELGEPEVVLDDLTRPYGLAFHEGWMYVGETDQVVRYRSPAYEESEVVVPDLPTGGHWTRELAFGPDGMLYLSVGSSCNVCEEEDPRRAAVIRYAPDGSGQRIMAEGLRNAAGLAFHPGTGVLWATQNERDQLGDDVPPEEINLIDPSGDRPHFGWPYCYGRAIANPEYREMGARCPSTTPPALEMQAHSAPLGMVFYDGESFPGEYRGDAFVAFHGSWNRSVPTGYKVVRIRVQNGRPVGYEDFATGWLRPDGEDEGRPVYPAVSPDGSLLVSDDGEGRIWRIRYTGSQTGSR